VADFIFSRMRFLMMADAAVSVSLRSFRLIMPKRLIMDRMTDTREDAL
jgi:hypothetical protein